MVGRRRVPEVVEPDLVERGDGLVRRDVPAELGGDRVGAHDQGDRVPADDRAEPPLERRVAGELGLALNRDGVDVGRVERRDRAGALVLRPLDDTREELAGALGTVVRDDRVERLEPLARLGGIEIGPGAVAGPVRRGARGALRHVRLTPYNARTAWPA